MSWDEEPYYRFKRWIPPFWDDFFAEEEMTCEEFPHRHGFPWEPRLEPLEEQEPLVDVLENEDEVRVIAWLPGVKQEITLPATAYTLTILAEARGCKYRKELELPAEVDPKGVKTSYRNGVLEVTLQRLEEKRPAGKRISIE